MHLRNLVAIFLLSVAALPASAQDAGSVLAQGTEYTAKEMIQGARDALTEMAGAADSVQKLVEPVERQGDPEVVDCVRTRLSAINALYGVSVTANEELQAALAVDQLARANHEYRKITVSLGKTRQFTSEAEACAGDGAVADETTQVTGGELGAGADETEGSGVDDGVVGVDPPGTTPFE